VKENSSRLTSQGVGNEHVDYNHASQVAELALNGLYLYMSRWLYVSILRVKESGPT